MIKPMLFNTEMVRALLSGQKTETRRLVKPTHLIKHPEVQEKKLIEKLCEPPCEPGDVLYVRETWGEDKNGFIYKADFSDADLEKIACVTKWRPSIHMPKKAARIFLKVTGVRVERLFDSFFKSGSSIQDLRAEGIHIPEVCAECIETYDYPCCNDEDAEGSECGNLDSVRDEFAKLWDSTIKPADLDRFGWAANPWVWVISFERCDKPEEICGGGKQWS